MRFCSTLTRSVASVLVCAGAVAIAAPRLDNVKEPESGTLFATTLSGSALSKDVTRPGSKIGVVFADQMLTGVGIREKTIFAVDVYAMGIYVEPKAAGKALDKWRGKSAKELQEDESFYTALLAKGLPTTLRLVMCRDVDGDDMAEAFEDSLEPRMKAILAKDAKLGKMQDLARFRSFFNVDEVEDGVELLFTWDMDGTLYTRMQGKPLGGITSPALSQSLFDIFLGAKPITKSAKKSLVERVPSVLAATKSTK